MLLHVSGRVYAQVLRFMFIFILWIRRLFVPFRLRPISAKTKRCCLAESPWVGLVLVPAAVQRGGLSCCWVRSVL